MRFCSGARTKSPEKHLRDKLHFFPTQALLVKQTNKKQNKNITKQTKNDSLSQEGRIDRLSALTEKKTMWIINKNVPFSVFEYTFLASQGLTMCFRKLQKGKHKQTQTSLVFARQPFHFSHPKNMAQKKELEEYSICFVYCLWISLI